jgi:hypothetical protein
MAAAYFMTWSLFNKKKFKDVIAVPEEGNSVRELGGAERFLSRHIPGTNKVDNPNLLVS